MWMVCSLSNTRIRLQISEASILVTFVRAEGSAAAQIHHSVTLIQMPIQTPLMTADPILRVAFSPDKSRKMNYSHLNSHPQISVHIRLNMFNTRCSHAISRLRMMIQITIFRIFIDVPELTPCGWDDARNEVVIYTSVESVESQFGSRSGVRHRRWWQTGKGRLDSQGNDFNPTPRVSLHWRITIILRSRLLTRPSIIMEITPFGIGMWCMMDAK